MLCVLFCCIDIHLGIAAFLTAFLTTPRCEQDQTGGGGNAWIKQLRVLRAFRLFRLFGKMGQARGAIFWIKTAKLVTERRDGVR
jgi:hypothetical protein